ncbi:MAG: hypothetical protein OXE42_06395 [Gammaproteobacteria bacterium]|nr:hypothetical protein [Gammaproteobacteria bacterium]
MRYLTLAVFLTLIMGFAGCGDAGDAGGDADAGDAAMDETSMEEAPADEAAMDEASDGPPQWQVLEQNVQHNE